jgi:hypothetical protein
LPSSLDGANTPSRIQHNGTTRRTTRTTPHSGLRLRLGKGDGLQLTPKLRAPDRETKPGESPVLVSQPPTRLTPDGMAKWVTGASNARHPPRRISTSSAPPSRASWSTSARPAEAAGTPGTRSYLHRCPPRRRPAYPESEVRRCSPILEPHTLGCSLFDGFRRGDPALDVVEVGFGVVPAGAYHAADLMQVFHVGGRVAVE